MARGIPPTVGNFFVVLSSLLTQYDAQQEERARRSKHGYHNIYALARYLEGVHETEDAILKQVNKNDVMTGEIAQRLIAELADHFTINPRTNEFDLAPLRKFYKQLDAFLSTGKNPSLVG